MLDNKLQSVAPEAALEMAQSGKWVFVDIRPAEIFEEVGYCPNLEDPGVFLLPILCSLVLAPQAHVEGAVSVPIFQTFKMGQGSMQDNMRAIAMMANGGLVPCSSLAGSLRPGGVDGKGAVMCSSAARLQA